MQDAAGIATTLNRVDFTHPLAAPLVAFLQRAASPASFAPLRLETNNATGAFFAYLAPDGYTAHGQALRSVDAAGRFLFVDAWARAAGHQRVPARALPSAYDAPPYAVTIDVLHLIEDGYLGWHIDDADSVDTGFNFEFADVNDKRDRPVYSENDALSDRPLLDGILAGVQSDDGRGSGQGGSAYVATGAWHRGFVARNRPTATSGPTVGFTCASLIGPTTCFSDAHQGGAWVSIAPAQANGRSLGPAAFVGYENGSTVQAGSARIGGDLVVAGAASARQLTVASPVGLASYRVADLPACGAGALAYARDARQPGEAAGQGHGALVFCDALGRWQAVNFAPVSR